ncbi:MAG: hypothetical protein HGB12_06550 [Bacteroidetes bacterium]|nr:hypothetical protein [Bacteroidota bacterium]
MLKKSFISIIFISIALLISSCGGAGKKDNKDKKDTVKTVKKDSIKANKVYTDIAKFISGMKVDEKSELYELSQTESFKNYSISSDSSWAKLEKRRLSKMRAWSETELSDMNKDIKTLFYPFSGPDFLHAQAFFPKTKKIIMFGLEPVGNIPDLKKIPKEKLSKFFSALNFSIEDVLKLSFFKTIDMSKELNSELISGALPIILLFVARTDHEIVDIKPTEIDKNGKMVYIDAFKNLKSEASYNKGVEIKYKDKEDTVLRTIYYFSANVADGGLKTNPNCTKFFENIENNVITMVKSASYLMHNPYFSVVRNTVLNKSKAFLQDDSGVAFKYIDQNKWNIQLYGIYNGPIQMFSNRMEKDLKQAYKDMKVKSINFQYGYGSKCGLLVARKK